MSLQESPAENLPIDGNPIEAEPIEDLEENPGTTSPAVPVIWELIEAVNIPASAPLAIQGSFEEVALPQLSPQSGREPFSAGLGYATPQGVSENGFPMKAIGAAATLMLLMGSSAGAVAANAAGAKRWGTRGLALTALYRLVGTVRTHRCEHCDVELRYRKGGWGEKKSGMTHGIHGHKHVPSRFFPKISN